MNVAVLAHSFPRFPGDTHGPFVKALSEAIVARGHSVHALIPFDPELRPDRATTLRIHPFRYVWPDRFHRLGYSRTLRRDVGMRGSAWFQAPLYFVAAERALGRLVRRERIDLIHAHWLLPNGFVAGRVAARSAIPYVVTLHGSDVFMAERNPLFRAMAKSAALGAAHITSCSAELRERLIRVAGHEVEDRIHLIPNGTDLVPAPSRATPGATRVVVAAGRLVDKKGFGYLIEAMPAILARNPGVRFVIGGGGELAGALEAQARALGVLDHVRITGMLAHHEMLALVAGADVFVMPSIRDSGGNVDGLPVVVLEAMAAGRPVVATDVSGIPLAVEHGRTGLLVPEKNADAIAGAVADLLENPQRARALGEAGRARVERELNWDAIAARHDELYRTSAVRAAPPRRQA
jgi:glycosyltransferase involved in cell wall biosynthesis